MKWSRDWRVYAISAGSVVGLAWLVSWATSSSSSGASSSLPAVFDPTGRWELIPEADTVALVRGVRYRGCVRLGSFNPGRLVLTVDRLRGALEDKGFRDVRVASGETPPNWPGGVDCFRYVDATWDQPDTELDRPGPVDLAWRWVPTARA